METKETKQIKAALHRRGKGMIRHGVQEVTVGHILGGRGYDRCDYLEFDNNGTFYAYEIKVSVADLNSFSKLLRLLKRHKQLLNKQIIIVLDLINNINLLAGISAAIVVLIIPSKYIPLIMLSSTILIAVSWQIVWKILAKVRMKSQ